MKVRPLIAICALALSCGCSRDEPNEGKLMPRLAPPPDQRAPAGLVIHVLVGDRELPPITSDVLDTKPPDFKDTQRVAWRLATLVGADVVNDRSAFVISSEKGVKTELPAIVDGEVPALLLSRRGEIVIELLNPQKPFPEFHGQGGRLGRSPGNRPRVEDPRQIRVVEPK